MVGFIQLMFNKIFSVYKRNNDRVNRACYIRIIQTLKRNKKINVDKDHYSM